MEKFLSLYAFDISEMDLPNYPLYQMDFPKEWLVFLKECQENYRSFVSLSALRTKLQSLFPQILAGYDDHLSTKEPKPWLIAVEEIPLAWIKRFSLSWLRDEFMRNKRLIDLVEQIPVPELSWRNYDLSEVKDDVRYQLIPGLFAHDFCREPRTLKFLDHVIALKFSHVFYGRDHECMSIPGTEKRHAFSYVLRFSLINRGGQAERDLLRVHVGTRRFYTRVDPLLRETNALHNNTKATFLLNIHNPYVHNEGTPLTFSALKFKKSKVDSASYAQWTMPIKDLYTDILQTQIQVDDFLTDPIRWMKGDGRIRGYFVYNSKAYSHEPFVKAGLGLPERTALIELVKSTWNLDQYHLTKIPELSVTVKGKNQRLPVQSLNMKNITVEFWMKEKMFRACLDILQTPSKQLEDQVLLIPTESENQYLLNSSQEVLIRVVQRDNSQLAQELDDEGRDEKRVKEIQVLASPAKKEPILAFIEIGEKNTYRQDPKQAVRCGMAKTGRLSQFIYALEGNNSEGEVTKKDTNRVMNAFMDLLSDAGFYRANITKIVPEAQIIAVGIVHRRKRERYRINEYLPVLLWFDGNETLIKRRGDKHWMSLREGLLDFKAIQVFHKRDKEQGKQFINWLEQELESILLKTRQIPIFLMVDATLRRSWWEGLQNGQIKAQELPLTRRLFHDTRLKIVRINHTSDVPQYDIMNVAKQSTINRSKGLFQDRELYYSVGSRPDTIQTRITITKLKSPGTLLLKQQAMELFPTGVSSQEEADDLASVAHLLRDANLTFKFSTSQPFPLHLLNSLRKYWQANLRSDERDYSGGGEDFGDDSAEPGIDERIRIRLRRRSGKKCLRRN